MIDPSAAPLGVSPTQLLADLATGLTGHELPREIRRMASTLLLDTLGCIVAGASTKAGKLVIEHSRGEQGPLSATLIGGGTVSLMPAAFSNCVMANAIDFDAFGPEGHMAAVVVPAAFAAAEAFDTAGEHLVAAITVGMEIGGRLGAALRRPTTSQTPLWGHTFAVIGAAAAAGRIMRLSKEEMLNAFGIAGYSAQLPSLRRFFSKAQDAMTKYDHLGLAARNGIEAALLAKRGFKGDRTILEGDYAFWQLSGAEGCDWDYLLDRLGTLWRTADVQHKAFPVGIGTVPILEVLLDLISRHDLRLDDIRTVVVRSTHAFVHKNLDVQTEIEAWTDLRYCVAMVLLQVRPFRLWYEPTHYLRPDVKSLMERIQVQQLPPLAADGTKRGRWAAQVELHTEAGVYLGGKDEPTPLDDLAVAVKFEDNVHGLLSDAAAKNIEELCMRVGELTSVREISRLLQIDL